MEDEKELNSFKRRQLPQLPECMPCSFTATDQKEEFSKALGGEIWVKSRSLVDAQVVEDKFLPTVVGTQLVGDSCIGICNTESEQRLGASLYGSTMASSSSV